MRTWEEVVKDETGAVISRESYPVIVTVTGDARRGRAHAHARFALASLSREHFEAFRTIVKGAGAKFLPGPREWEIPADQAESVIASLCADGFVLRTVLWDGQEDRGVLGVE